MTGSLVAYSLHALLIGFGGRGHIVWQKLVMWGKDFCVWFAFIIVDTQPLAEENWPSFAIFFAVCAKIGTLKESYSERTWFIRSFGWSGMWQTDEEQSLEGWKGWRGSQAGWGGRCYAFKGTGMFGWHSPPPAPLPLFMCHSMSSRV